MINSTGISALTFFLQCLTNLAGHRQMSVEGQYAPLLGSSISAVQQSEIMQDATAAEFRLRCSLRDTLLALRGDLVGTPFAGAFDSVVDMLSSPAPYCDKAHTPLAVLLGQLAVWSERQEQRQRQLADQRQTELPPHHHS